MLDGFDAAFTVLGFLAGIFALFMGWQTIQAWRDRKRDKEVEKRFQDKEDQISGETQDAKEEQAKRLERNKEPAHVPTSDRTERILEKVRRWRSASRRPTNGDGSGQ